MSEYVDSFIKDHREYFLRNKNIIYTNTWNDIESYNKNINSFAEQLNSIQNSKDKDKDKKIKEIESTLKKYLDTSSKGKKALFKQENKLTNSILGRLTDFINETEKNGDRKQEKEKTQRFIDETVDIINIHLKKCSDYLKYGSDIINKEAKTEDEIEYNDLEIDFQDDIFIKKVEIQNTLKKVNITGDISNTTIEFHEKKKASFVLREPVCLLREDVKEITDRIPVNWDVRTSKEMFINMRPQDIPKWNKDKHYFYQTPEVLQFWAEEYNKIIYGLNIGGFYMHGWLYFHLNFFRTPIPQSDGREPNIQPPLRDNEWFFAENLKKCESKEYPAFYSKAMLVYGTRRFGKSVILASLAHWRTIAKFNSFGSIIGGNSSDLNALTSKIKTSMTYIDAPLRMPILKQEWDNGETTFGIKNDASNPIIFSTLIVQNLEQGTAKKSQKTAGLAPSVSIYDEIGKYDFLKPYLAALPSFKTPYGFKCVTALAGTGGEASLSKDAMKVLSSPETYDLLPMDWDLLQTNIDPEHITWKKRNFATFFPGQMAYEDGFIKERIPLSDFMGNSIEGLKGIDIDVTNWERNTKYLEQEIKEAQDSPDSNLLVQQRRVQYPTDPEHCFLSAEKNPFCYEDAVRHKEYLELSGLWDRRRKLYKNSEGKIKSEMSSIPLVDYPFTGGNVDAPFLIFEDIPEERPPMYYYVAGLDDYKQVTSNTDSVGTIYIYKYDIFGDAFAKKLVASYSGRPGKHKDFHKNCLLLLDAYNASCFMENEDTGFIEFLEELHLEDKYLMKAVDFTSSLNITNNAPRKFGWSPKQSKTKLLNMFVNYCNADIPSINEDGEEITIKGITRINDIHLLNEIINFKDGGNFDRISASLGAIGWLHYLETNYISPISNHNNKEVVEHKKPHVKRIFGGNRGRGILR